MAATRAHQALTSTAEGTGAVRQTLEGMSSLRSKVEAIAEQILRLSEQTGQISNITNLVSELANQTDLLALNAAVEAARAGEHGKQKLDALMKPASDILDFAKIEARKLDLEPIKFQLRESLLIDAQMPEMDGFEATAAIREVERLRGGHTPIIAMTAHAMMGDRQRCLQAGIDGHISKPIQAQTVFDAIEAARSAHRWA